MCQHLREKKFCASFEIRDVGTRPNFERRVHDRSAQRGGGSFLISVDLRFIISFFRLRIISLSFFLLKRSTSTKAFSPSFLSLSLLQKSWTHSCFFFCPYPIFSSFSSFFFLSFSLSFSVSHGRTRKGKGREGRLQASRACFYDRVSQPGRNKSLFFPCFLPFSPP